MSLADYGIITDLAPLGGGWRYPQPFEGRHVTLRPEHAPKGRYLSEGDRLVAGVREFRLRHRLDLGNPEQDVAEFVKAASPRNFPHRDPSRAPQGRPARALGLAQRLREWLSGVSPLRPQLLSAHEAGERAHSCLDCPHNLAWKTGERDVDQEIAFASDCLRACVDFSLDYALKGCDLHGIALQSAVFLDRDHLPPRRPDAPPACWLPSPATHAHDARPGSHQSQAEH